MGAEGFFALDMRAGRVTAVEDFPEARNPAYKVTVDFGPEVGVLTTSAQVAHYPKAALLGRLVVGAVNLGAKRIAGFKSEFLILGTSAEDGRVLLLEVDPETPLGSPVS